MFSRTLIYLKLCRNAEALTDYDSAVKANPQQASALFGRGIAKLRTGDRIGGENDIVTAKGILATIPDRQTLTASAALETRRRGDWAVATKGAPSLFCIGALRRLGALSATCDGHSNRLLVSERASETDSLTVKFHVAFKRPLRRTAVSAAACPAQRGGF